jgi:hypothetical protein
MIQAHQYNSTFGGPGSLFDPDATGRNKYPYGILVVVPGGQVVTYKMAGLSGESETVPQRCVVEQVDAFNYHVTCATIRRIEELVMGYIAGYPARYLKGGITYETIWLVCMQDQRCLEHGRARFVPRGFAAVLGDSEKALPGIPLSAFEARVRGIRLSVIHVIAVTYTRDIMQQPNPQAHFMRLCVSIGTSAASPANERDPTRGDTWWVEVPIDILNKAFRAHVDRALAALDAGADADFLALGPDTIHMLSLQSVS